MGMGGISWGWGGMGWIRTSTPQSPPQSRSKALRALRIPQGFTSCSQDSLQSPCGATGVPNRTHSQLGANQSRVLLGALDTNGVPRLRRGCLVQGQAVTASPPPPTYLALSHGPTEPLISAVSAW